MDVGRCTIQGGEWEICTILASEKELEDEGPYADEGDRSHAEPLQAPQQPHHLLLVGLRHLLLLDATALHAFVPGLLPLELVQLDEQVVDVLQVLDLVDLLEAVEKGNPADVEDVDADLHFPVEETDALGFVVLLVEEVEVDVPEVHHKQVHHIFTIFLQLFEHCLLIFLCRLPLTLAQLQLSVKVSRQIFYLLDLGPHSHLHDDELFFGYDGVGTVGVQFLEGEGQFSAFQTLALGGVEVVELLLELRQVEGRFGKEALRGKLFDLFLF